MKFHSLKIRTKLVAISFLFSIFTFSVFAQDDTNVNYEQALTAFNNGELEEAYIHLKNALQQQPSNLPAKILIGKVLLESGYSQEAEFELLEALELGGDPNLIVKWLALAILLQQEYDDVFALDFNRLSPTAKADLNLIKATAHLITGDLTRARMMLSRIVQSDPANSEAINQLADLEIKAGNLTKAQQLVDQSNTVSSANPVTLRLQAELFAKQGNNAEAESFYIMGLSASPQNPIIMRDLAALYVRTEQFLKARKLIDQILESTPDDPMGILLDSWVLVQENKPDDAMMALDALSNAVSALPSNITAASPDFVFIQGLAHFAKGEYESARSYFSEFINLSDRPEAAVVFLVDVHMKLGESSEAIKLLERFPKTIEDSFDLVSIAIDAYLSTNRTHRAISLVDRLKEKYPGSSIVPLFEARILAFRGKNEEAINILSLPELADSEAYLLAKSQIFLSDQQFQAALSDIDKLIAQSPNNPDYMNLKAAALLKLDDYNAAERLIEQSLEIKPTHFSARFNQAALRAETGALTESESILISLIEQIPNHEQSVVLLANIEANTQRPARAIERLNDYLIQRPSAILAREAHVKLLIRAQRFSQAQRELSTLIKRTELNSTNMLTKAQIHIGLNELESARLEYTKLNSMWQDSASDLYNLSLRQTAIEDYAGAIKSLQMAAKLSPLSQLIPQELIKNHLQLGDLDKAEQLLNSLVAKSGENANSLMLKGDIARLRNQLDVAYTLYKQSIITDITFNQALVKLYLVTNKLPSQTDFADTIEKMLTSESELLFHRNLLADYYLNRTEFDKAEVHLRILSNYEDFGNRALVLNNLANIILNKGKNEEALAMSLQAYEIDSGIAAIVDTYGWALVKNGLLEQALQHLRRAYAMDSSDPNIQFHLGYTLIQLGNIAEGRQQVENALSSNQAFIEREDALSLISQYK